MAVFNSLGSNYSLPFILESLIGFSFRVSQAPLKEELSSHYGGKVTLTYKGRQALELALRQSGLPKASRIGINGFTCYVVYEAVVDAGYKPVFLDVAAGQLNFGAQELIKTHADDKQLGAVIVQNTLGLPCDMSAIADYCSKNGIMIIEDLAHSLDAVYSDGREAGTAGSLTMLSFSQDKPLDVVAGGALIDRRPEAEDQTGKLQRVKLSLRFRNRLYPFWSWLIRVTYPLGLGRIIHAGLKKLHALSTPMNDSLRGIQRMSGKASMLLLSRWHSRNQEAAHRRRIAAIYQAALPKDNQLEFPSGSQPLYLRFPILVSDRMGLVAALKQAGIYIGDTWYDAPIGPKRYLADTTYKMGLCPRAEKLSETIVNLPTHINVSTAQAEDIAERVNRWLSK